MQEIWECQNQVVQQTKWKGPKSFMHVWTFECFCTFLNYVHYQKNAHLMILSNAISEILNLPLIDYKCYLKFVKVLLEILC